MDTRHAINIEKVILSSIIFNPELMDEISGKLQDTDFYLIDNQKVFEIMQNLYKNDLPIDEEFIAKRLKKQEVSDNAIVEIISTSPTPNVLAYVNEIIEESKKRQITKISVNIHKSLNDELTSSEMLYNITKDVDMIEENTFNKMQTSVEIINEVKNKMLEAYNNNGEILGQKSGLKELDKIIGGFEDGDLVIIAARPSMGKTSIISAFANKILEEGNGLLIESLEMPSWKIMQRLISSRSEENLSDIKKGLIRNKNKFAEATEFFACENLVINDNTYPTVNQLQSRIKSIIRKNKKIKNIFVDHTGKIALEGKTREDIEIGHITNMLKKIARDFNIRVFLLQQLNRGVESRDNKRPMLSDLKNSGNIEEDADIVLGLYRDSYYKKKDNELKEKAIEQAEIIILKNRDGEIGTAKVAFEGKCARFLDSKLNDYAPEITVYKDS